MSSSSKEQPPNVSTSSKRTTSTKRTLDEAKAPPSKQRYYGSQSAGSSSSIVPGVRSNSKTPIVVKRPYRRTKRPAGYNDKSSITVTTDTMVPLNVYDAVLAESNDLLQAAMEAQQLGRLKMASAYLLLLHARLVGLGKRFDKSMNQKKHDAAVAAVAASVTGAAAATESMAQNHNENIMSSSTTTTGAVPRELVEMLPNHIELDTQMMEHLARAAAELHAARSGRHHHHHHNSNNAEAPNEGSTTTTTTRRPALLSPDTHQFLAATGNQQGVTNAATMTGVAKSVACWAEVNRLRDQGKNPKEISAQLLGGTRTEQQVKNFVKADDERKKVEQEMISRKPVTAALSTVPYAVCDARTLLQGGPLLETDKQTTTPQKKKAKTINM